MAGQRFTKGDVIAAQDGIKVGTVIGYANGSMVYEKASGDPGVAPSDTKFKLYEPPRGSRVTTSGALTFRPIPEDDVRLLRSKHGRTCERSPFREKVDALIVDFALSEASGCDVSAAVSTLAKEMQVPERTQKRTGEGSSVWSLVGRSVALYNKEVRGADDPKIITRTMSAREAASTRTRFFLLKEVCNS